MAPNICKSCGKPWPSCENTVCITCEMSIESDYNMDRVKGFVCKLLSSAGASNQEFHRCSGEFLESVSEEKVGGYVFFSKHILPEFIGVAHVNGVQIRFAVLVREWISMGELKEAKLVAENWRANCTFIMTLGNARDFVDYVLKGGRNVLRTSYGGDIFLGKVSLENGNVDYWIPEFRF